MSHLLTRRQLMAGIAAAPALRAWQERARPGEMKITSVDFLRLEGKRESLAGMDRQHQVQGLHIYPEHRPAEYRDPANPTQGTSGVSAVYLRLRTDKGLEGIYGPIDREAALIVDAQLKSFVLGKDPLAVEGLWDKMYRSNRHARRGTYMMAISAIDNAVWDLRGRYFNAPVYQLLGGPTRRSVEAYGSMLGYSVQPEAVRKRVAEFRDLGFRHQKWFLAYGPGDGTAGLARNVELVRNLRESGGPEVELMFDAFMGWQLDYAISWCKQVEQYRPRWIEEAFPVDRIEAFAQLRRSTSVPVASGEHFYGRWEAHDYLRAGAISVVQADPEWCGGVSELVKICHVASLFDAQVVPHGHSVHSALHVVASQSPSTCPLVEYLHSKMKSYYWFETAKLEPVKGFIALPDRPGFGIEFDPARVLKQTAVSFGG
ncbi:MAG TPA: enolase C-terminal domain-like protein [Bryobacteraceae bacterium]|nr:enolase C-terminal domain-like protein [Bryobacteraceae bacterium]